VAGVVDGGVRSRGGRGGTTGVDDRRTSLGHGGDEVLGDPVLVTDGLGGGPAGHGGVEDVRVLGGRVVAPDGQVRDVGDSGAGLGRQLAHRPVVVQAGHRGEAVLGHVG